MGQFVGWLVSWLVGWLVLLLTSGKACIFGLVQQIEYMNPASSYFRSYSLHNSTIFPTDLC